MPLLVLREIERSKKNRSGTLSVPPLWLCLYSLITGLRLGEGDALLAPAAHFEGFPKAILAVIV